MDTTKKIEDILTPPLAQHGFDIVRVQLSGSRRPVLQIMIECQDGTPITVDHCANVSRVASAYLDLEDPIKSAFVLEVSSPGLARPLVKPKDFIRYQGHTIEMTLMLPQDGRKRFQGLLETANEEEIVLVYDQQTSPQKQNFKISDIKSAKLHVDFVKV